VRIGGAGSVGIEIGIARVTVVRGNEAAAVYRAFRAQDAEKRVR
jgi:hypothetical protein